MQATLALFVAVRSDHLAILVHAERLPLHRVIDRGTPVLDFR
jgi:hypothetical protein